MATQTQTVPITVQDKQTSAIEAKLGSRQKPQSDSSLKDVKAFDVTPVIGREFPEADLKEWLESSKSDQLIKDLAITSKFLYSVAHLRLAECCNSLPAWSSLLPETGWPDKRPAKEVGATAWRVVRQTSRVGPTHPSRVQQRSHLGWQG